MTEHPRISTGHNRTGHKLETSEVLYENSIFANIDTKQHGVEVSEIAWRGQHQLLVTPTGLFPPLLDTHIRVHTPAAQFDSQDPFLYWYRQPWPDKHGKYSCRAILHDHATFGGRAYSLCALAWTYLLGVPFSNLANLTGEIRWPISLVVLVSLQALCRRRLGSVQGLLNRT